MEPKNLTHLVRLNKFISDSGFCSRRKADSLIQEGVVKVNGEKVLKLGSKVDASNDNISINGKKIKTQTKKQYLMFYKPKKVLTSTSDPTGRPIVSDFFDHFEARLFPVGRLDWDTEGLLLMTNDGEFSQAISHPKEEVPKTYLAKLDQGLKSDDLERLLRGVTIPAGRVKAQSIHKVRPTDSSKNWVKIVITEGKNRQVRNMFHKVGYDVVKLKRVAIGRLTIGSLKPGSFKHLSPLDIHKIFTAEKDYTPKKTSKSKVAQIKTAKSKVASKKKSKLNDSPKKQFKSKVTAEKTDNAKSSKSKTPFAKSAPINRKKTTKKRRI